MTLKRTISLLHVIYSGLTLLQLLTHVWRLNSNSKTDRYDLKIPGFWVYVFQTFIQSKCQTLISLILSCLFLAFCHKFRCLILLDFILYHFFRLFFSSGLCFLIRVLICWSVYFIFSFILSPFVYILCFDLVCKFWVHYLIHIGLFIYVFDFDLLFNLNFFI